MRIAIRREDKNRWERRTPLTPDAVAELQSICDAQFVVQPSPIRVFPDHEYEEAGALLQEDFRDCDLILAVKEVPLEQIYRDKAYVFFSHTIKGQSYNMGLLRRMMEQGISLFDYERIVDDEGRRLVFFGRHAGYAGMLDTLRAYADRLEKEGRETLLDRVRSAWQYDSLDAARHELRSLGNEIREKGLGRETGPLVVGFTGFGNVSKGAQSVLEELPVEHIDLEQLLRLEEEGFSDRVLYAIELSQQHMFRRKDGEAWDEQRYWSHPEEYESNMDRVLPRLSILVNGILWTEEFPRLVTRELVASLWSAGEPRLRVIGDISIDIEGSIEWSVKATPSDEPCYTVDPRSGAVHDGVHGKGLVIMAVDNLPCELPRESSDTFSAALSTLIPYLVRADLDLPFEQLDLPLALKRSLILHKGQLTPDYAYMAEFLKP